MSLNERPSRRANHVPESLPVRPCVEECTLQTETIQIERKSFVFVLKENPRGRFVRITEDVHGRRDAIIIPAPGLEDFRKVLDGLSQVAAQPTPKPA